MPRTQTWSLLAAQAWMPSWSQMAGQASQIGMTPAAAQSSDTNHQYGTGGSPSPLHTCGLWWKHESLMSKKDTGYVRTMNPDRTLGRSLAWTSPWPWVARRQHTSVCSSLSPLFSCCLFPQHVNCCASFSLAISHHKFTRHDGIRWACECLQLAWTVRTQAQNRIFLMHISGMYFYISSQLCT